MREKFTKILRLTVSVITLTVLIGILMPAQASAATITVPTDYGTIQEAINAASTGDTIYVKSGTYYEHLTINKPIILQGEDKSTTIIDGSGYGNVIFLDNTDGVIISDITAKNGQTGIYLPGSTYNTLKNIIVSDNTNHGINLGDWGLYGDGAHHNTLENIEAYSNGIGVIGYAGTNNMKLLDSKLYDNTEDGVLIGWSSGWVIKNTVIHSNGRAGVGIDTSSYGTIENCELYNNNAAGIIAGGVSSGERYNTIVGNKIHSNKLGIDIWSSFRYNTIKENQIYDNEEGIAFQYIEGYLNYGNTLYHNDLNNTVNAKVYGNAPQNTWNNWNIEYPAGGNFYSDYTGADQFSGAGQNEGGSDGIGDSSYTIAGNNIDRYPLMKPWHSDFPYQPPATNQLPVAKAGGPYQADEGSSVNFDASSSSDPDGDTLQYRWDFESDGTWDTAWSNDPTATHTWADDWSGSATLEVSDGELTSTDTATVTISNTNPVVEAGEDKTANEGDEVSFSGSYSDAGSADIQTIKWDFGDGKTASDTLIPTHVYANNGVYTATLTVTDDEDGVGTDTLTVTVENANPVVEAGEDKTANEGDSVSFSGSYSDVGTADTHTIEWDFGDGTTASDTLTPTHVYTDNGTYTATLTVTDDGGVGTDTLTVTVNNANPVVEAGNEQIVDEGDEVSLSGSFTDGGSADTHTIGWDFGDGSSASNTLTPTHIYAENGTFTATLTITDDDGGIGTDTVTVTVNNANPVVEVGSDKTTINEGDSISFSGSYTDVGSADTHTFLWDFGDDTTISDTLNPTHVYADNGVYTATLTVTDDDGGIGTDTLTITVNNMDPSVGEIEAPIDPTSLKTPIITSCTFTDAGLEDTHTGVWNWGDGTSSGTVSESNGAGKVTGEHVYTEAGVYWVTLTVTDDDGGSSSVTTGNYVVIYNPEGGFVTGGGWINSPENAYAANPDLIGKATFGFVSKYEKGATVPTGKTEFQFKVADLNFKSTSYDWLVVAGSKAKYKGTGTINGEGNYGFMLSAVDGDTIDKFRINIWDKDNGDITVYDNEIDSGIKIEEDVEPSTAISGGSIVVHKE